MKTPFKYLVTDVNKKIKECLKLIRTDMGTKAAPMYKDIEVRYDLDSSNALGTHQFIGGKHIIRLNAGLLNELKQDYINEVVVHELGHALVRHNYGFANRGKRVMPHGKEFKMFCRMMGISGKSTTNVASGSQALKDSGRKTSRYTYNCGCQEFELTTVRHNKIRRGTASYNCKCCGGTLKFGKLKK